mmetsp:Transcript_8762/g.32804  ORF Transcript_8762/g.32804 Transcript_8762/m.32804 type:complete len:182 (+) Transcript_8762:539-1084(+)
MYLNKRMYSEWTTGTLPDGKIGGVFHYLRASGEFSVESFPADNGPDTPIPDLLTSILAAWSVEKEQDVARWGDAASRRYGTFFVVEDTNTGAVLVDKRDGAVYKVFGIKTRCAGRCFGRARCYRWKYKPRCCRSAGASCTTAFQSPRVTVLGREPARHPWTRVWRGCYGNGCASHKTRTQL